MISGNGTFVTGGTLENEREVNAPAIGPSSTGGKIISGQSRTIGPGDVVVIPPNTPHQFSEVASDRIVYLLIRVDPHKVPLCSSRPSKPGMPCICHKLPEDRPGDMDQARVIASLKINLRLAG